MWVNRSTDQTFLLWLIWSGVDRVGPLELGKLLFKAYNASLLSAKIDPFIVEVRSRREVISNMLLQSATGEKAWRRIVINNTNGAASNDDDVPGVLRYTWRAEWVYHLQANRRASVDLAKDWRRFSERITALAA